MQSLISAKLLCECRQRGLESNLTSGMLGLLFVLQTLGYSLEATPTIFGCLQLVHFGCLQLPLLWTLWYQKLSSATKSLLFCFCIFFHLNCFPKKKYSKTKIAILIIVVLPNAQRTKLFSCISRTELRNILGQLQSHRNSISTTSAKA